MHYLRKFLFVGIALLALLALATGQAAAQQINVQVTGAGAPDCRLDSDLMGSERG